MTSVSQAHLSAWRASVIQWSRGERSFHKILRTHAPLLMQIWRAYNTDRRNLGKLPMSAAKMVAPYLLGFHLPNYLRAKAILQRLDARANFDFSNRTISILDLGCGTGAATLALCEWLTQHKVPHRAFEVSLLDRSRHLLAAAEALFAQIFPEIEAKTTALHIDANTLRPDARAKTTNEDCAVQFVVMSYVWNEVSSNRPLSFSLLSQFKRWASSAQPYFLLLMDPARENSAKELMGLRDDLANMGWTWLYPCPQNLMCPLRAQTKDWCYSEIVPQKPDELKKIERVLNVNRSTLGVAGYFAANPAAKNLYQKITPRERLVVGRPQTAWGYDVLLCQPSLLSREQVSGRRPGGPQNLKHLRGLLL